MRLTTKDDVYQDNGVDHFIPKGSIIIPNIRGFLHDVRDFKDPMVFNPDRFMPSEKGPGERDPRGPCFGFGRRICPGELT
jgi:cytochrome P450